jgi:hypothetical protein
MGTNWAGEIEMQGRDVSLTFSRAGSRMSALVSRKDALALADGIYSACGATPASSGSSKTLAPSPSPAKKGGGRKGGRGC